MVSVDCVDLDVEEERAGERARANLESVTTLADARVGESRENR